MSPSTKTRLIMVISLSIFALMIYFGRQVQQSIAPNIMLNALVSPPCDLHKTTCISKFQNGASVSLSIAPAQIPSLQPLYIRVKTTKITTSKVDIDFIGTEMDMGYNRVTLNPLGLNHFSGQAIIPACMHSKMLWTARVLLHTEQGILMAPFQFESIKSTR